MVLALIILISLFLLWLIVSPCFESIGRFFNNHCKELFKDEGEEKDEKR